MVRPPLILRPVISCLRKQHPVHQVYYSLVGLYIRDHHIGQTAVAYFLDAQNSLIEGSQGQSGTSSRRNHSDIHFKCI